MDNESCEMYVNQKELADILGITTRRVRQLKQEGIIVETEKNKYPIETNCQSYISYKSECEGAHRLTDDRKEDLEELERLKAEHEAIKTEISKIRLGRMNGSLISMKNFEAFLTVKLNNVVQQLDELPARIAFATAGMNQYEAIQTANKLVQDIVDDLKQYPDGNDYNFEAPYFDYLDDEDDEDDYD